MNIETLQQTLTARTPGVLGAKSSFAVLCPLVQLEQGDWGLLFEIRAATLRAQPREICFPGGRQEPGETPRQTALRETQEELNLPPQTITLLGELDFIAHPSGFTIYPVLGVVDDLSALAPSAAEVDDTFIVPLSFFQQTPPLSAVYDLTPQVPDDFPFHAINITPPYPFRGAQVESPVWRYEGHAIWGFTARIVAHVLSLMEFAQK